MASSEETLLAWLKSLAPEEHRVESLADVLDPEHEGVRAVVRDITGATALSRPVEALDKWLQSSGNVFVMDATDPTSVAKAALGAAVHCDQKDEYVRRMMGLDQDFQATLMVLIHEFNSEMEKGEAAQLRALVRRLERDVTRLRALEDEQRTSPDAAGRGSVDLTETRAAQERAKELERTVRELTSHCEEVESELQDTKQALAKASRGAEEKIATFEEELRAQADELDVARAKAAQLVKAEAKVAKLMQKLEETSVLRNQLKELQEESQSSLDKKLEMEAEMKTVGTLKQQLETYKNKSVDLESQVVRLQNECRHKDEELAQSVANLKAARDRESFLKEQVDAGKEAIAQLEAEVELGAGGAGGAGTAGGAIGSPVSSALAADLHASASPPAEAASSKLEKREMEQRIALLTEENRELSERLEAALSKAKSESASSASDDVVDRLKQHLKEKEAECLQLVTDKEKLQNYVKQSLHATQAKYKVALKTLQTQLEEKTEMIQNFKAIREEDEATHRREQKLVMASFYDIGLEIQRRTASATAGPEASTGSWLVRARQGL